MKLNTEELNYMMTLLEGIEEAEAKELDVIETTPELSENSQYRVPREVVIKKAAARRAVLIAQSIGDPMYNQYKNLIAQLKMIKKNIYAKYGTEAHNQAVSAYKKKH